MLKKSHRLLSNTENNHPSSEPKFKQLKTNYNELQSKYDIFKNGTPNNYEQDL